MAPLGKILVLFGFIIAGVGALMMFSDKIPFIGKLPGDVTIRKENFHVYIPVTTSILVSVVISVVWWLISLLNKK
jgi:uncharacterized protein HemY